MARGPKKHMKRLAAPKHWMVDKLSGVYAPKCRPGAHKGREALPLGLVLRNRLKYALTRKECMMITKQRLVKVDGRVRTDPKTPVGFMDAVAMEKTGDFFRVLYDVKGRYVLNKVGADAMMTKVCRVVKVWTAENNVPCLSTHDGRTLRYPDPLIAVGDSIILNLETSKVSDFLKFKPGMQCMVTGGANTGRVGEVVDVEKHPGAFDIVHVLDANGNTFATRKNNIFIIGRSSSDLAIQLPKGNGIRVPLTQDREQRIANIAKSRKGGKKH